MYTPRSCKRESNPVRIRAGRDDKVILELALIAVHNQVHARIDTLVFDLCIVGNIRAPLGGVVADEVVALAGQLIHTYHLRGGVGPGKLHAQH